MKLEEQYPTAFANFTTPDGFMKGSGQPSECEYCEAPTSWYHKALGLRFCSRECYVRYAAAHNLNERKIP